MEGEKARGGSERVCEDEGIRIWCERVNNTVLGYERGV